MESSASRSEKVATARFGKVCESKVGDSELGPVFEAGFGVVGEEDVFEFEIAVDYVSFCGLKREIETNVRLDQVQKSASPFNPP